MEGRMFIRTWLRVAAVLVMATCGFVRVSQAADGPVKPDEQILRHLDHTVDWYRRVTSLDQTQVRAEELLFRDSTERNARRVLRLGFDAARAQAELLNATPPAPATTSPATTRKGPGSREARLSQSAAA